MPVVLSSQPRVTSSQLRDAATVLPFLGLYFQGVVSAVPARHFVLCRRGCRCTSGYWSSPLAAFPASRPKALSLWPSWELELPSYRSYNLLAIVTRHWFSGTAAHFCQPTADICERHYTSIGFTFADGKWFIVAMLPSLTENVTLVSFPFQDSLYFLYVEPAAYPCSQQIKLLIQGLSLHVSRYLAVWWVLVEDGWFVPLYSEGLVRFAAWCSSGNLFSQHLLLC